MKTTISLIVFIFATASFCQNIITGDSDFETGPSWLLTTSYNCSAKWEIDKTSRAHGMQSVKLLFPEKDWFYSRLFPLKAREYTLSFYAKSDKENSSILAGIWRPWSECVSKKFKLSKEWKRYSFTKKLKKGGYCWMFFGSEEDGNEIWIDSAQLEKGSKATDYKPSKSLYSGIRAYGDKDRVFYINEKVPVTLTVIDSTGKVSEAAIDFTITDTFNKTVKKEVRTVKFDDSGRWTETFDFHPGKNGFYFMTLSAQSGLEKSDPFFLSAAVVDPPPKSAKDAFPFLGADGAKRAGLARIGSSWTETGFRWNRIEKEKGKYNWGSSDKVIAAKKAGFKVKVLVFGVPKWAWDKWDAEELKKSGAKIKSHASLLPSEEGLEAFRKFMVKAAERYKDYVDLWEIGAEDDLLWGRNSFYTKKYSDSIDNSFATGPFSEKVAQIYNIGIEAIRSVIPDAKIGLLRPSGVDCTSRDYTFTKSVLKHVNKKFDFLPLDPYCYPRYLGAEEAPSDQPDLFLQDDLERALKTTAEVAQGQPVYVSELGYAINAAEPMNNKYHLDLASRMLKSIVIARSNPKVKMLSWFVTQGGAEGGKARYNMWWDDNPAIAVPVFSAAAHLIDGALEVKELPLGENLKAYVFKKENGAAAALWSTGEKGKVSIDKQNSLRIVDFSGGKINPTENLTLEQYPILFSLSGKNAFEDICKLITTAKYDFPPVKMFLLVQARDKARLIVRNNMPKQRSLIVNAKISGKEMKKAEINISDKKSSEAEINIPLPEEKDSFALDISAKVEGYPETLNKTYDLSFIPLRHVENPIKIDGNLDDWNEKNLSKIFEGKAEINPPDPHIPYFGYDDFSAKIYAGWDENNLYFAAAVKDDVHANKNSGFRMWNGDCLQIAIDSQSDAALNKKAEYDANDFELGLSINSKVKNEFYVWHRKNKKPIYDQKRSFALRDEKSKTTFYEIAVPWKAMDINIFQGKTLGLNYMLLDDDDGSGASYWFQMTGKNPAEFKRFYLVK